MHKETDVRVHNQNQSVKENLLTEKLKIYIIRNPVVWYGGKMKSIKMRYACSMQIAVIVFMW